MGITDIKPLGRTILIIDAKGDWWGDPEFFEFLKVDDQPFAEGGCGWGKGKNVGDGLDDDN